MNEALQSRTNMSIAEALTDEAILATRDLMRQLRPVVTPDAYLPTVRRMMQTDGYHLAALSENQAVRAVPAAPAGGRRGGWGRDGLGTGARGMGARARRALMSTTLCWGWGRRRGGARARGRYS
jgi:CBS domain-containing protein